MRRSLLYQITTFSEFEKYQVLNTPEAMTLKL